MKLRSILIQTSLTHDELIARLDAIIGAPLSAIFDSNYSGMDFDAPFVGTRDGLTFTVQPRPGQFGVRVRGYIHDSTIRADLEIVGLMLVTLLHPGVLLTLPSRMNRTEEELRKALSATR